MGVSSSFAEVHAKAVDKRVQHIHLRDLKRPLDICCKIVELMHQNPLPVGCVSDVYYMLTSTKFQPSELAYMLHWAVSFGQLEVCEELLNLGVDPDVLDHAAASPLRKAAQFGHAKVPFTGFFDTCT